MGGPESQEVRPSSFAIQFVPLPLGSKSSNLNTKIYYIFGKKRKKGGKKEGKKKERKKERKKEKFYEPELLRLFGDIRGWFLGAPFGLDLGLGFFFGPLIPSITLPLVKPFFRFPSSSSSSPTIGFMAPDPRSSPPFAGSGEPNGLWYVGSSLMRLSLSLTSSQLEPRLLGEL